MGVIGPNYNSIKLDAPHGHEYFGANLLTSLKSMFFGFHKKSQHWLGDI
jgi:hypothetical protein